MVTVNIHEAHYRTSARLVSVLGEQLIRDNTVGLMELVKNGYDADASEVTICLENLKNPKETRIIVKDNGKGMDLKTLKGPWLRVADGDKEVSKQRSEKTPKGRIPLGEKGVGRFAAHKLGKKLELVTRPENYPMEFVLIVDWDVFENMENDLQEIGLQIKERDPEIFVNDQHGTQLTMTEARTPWQMHDLKRFYSSIVSLISPYRGVPGFKVVIKCPEFPEFENLETPDLLENYQFRIDCMIDEKGHAQYEYRWRNVKKEENIKVDECNLWARVNADGWQDRYPARGPIFIQISAWLDKNRTLKKFGLTKDQIKDLGGVSIYRDGFRILPYGDEGDDWLGLDQRRINDPSSRFGNRQVLGIVEIDQVHNLALIDKTNREGLQENQAFLDLKALVLGTVQILEVESLDERRKVNPPPKKEKELETTVRELLDKIKSLEKEKVETVKDKYETPQFFDLSNQTTIYTEASCADSTALSKIPEHEETEQVAIPKAKLKELERVAKSIEEIYLSQEQEREIFLHLLGVGLAAERFAHEFDRQVSQALAALSSLKNDNKLSERQEIKLLDLIINSLRNEVRLMGTLRFVKRVQPAQMTDVREIIELVLIAHNEQFTENNIKIEALLDDNFLVKISPASLAQVLDNIISNAIHWLKQKSEKNNRRLKIELLGNDRVILISNNGPYMPPSIRNNLFTRPFVTLKADGRGLGMYIVNEIMQRNKGNIQLVSNEDYPSVLEGVGFKLTFEN
ncbi:ATP-binding protein [Thermincola ferriacetica]